MSDEHKPDDRLDRATAALRDTPVPAMPADLVERIVAATRPAQNQTRKTRKRIPMKTIFKLAAALLLCASVLGFLMVTGTPRVAFAEAITALKEIKTVQAHSTATVVMPGSNEQHMDGEMVIVAPDKARMSTTADRGNGQPPDEQVQIFDYGTGQSLTLLRSARIAILRTQTGIPEKERPISIIQELINADAKSAKPVAEKEINGKKVQGFELSREGMTITVWIDPATRLPVELEVVPPQNPQMPGARATIVFSDFVWNEPVDPSLVSLDVPAGYQLQKSNPTPFQLSEQDLINTLKETADFLGGHYPDGFDIQGLSYDLGTRTGMASGQPDEQKLVARSVQIQGMASRAWRFMASPEYGTDFQYAGKGKKVGTKDPILWYRPAGSDKYRLIDASLNVTDVAADQLPKVKSQPLSSAPTAAPAAR